MPPARVASRVTLCRDVQRVDRRISEFFLIEGGGEYMLFEM